MALVLRTLYDFPKPMIAAVNGPAIAGGMALATIPDFTLAPPEVQVWLHRSAGGLYPGHCGFISDPPGGRIAHAANCCLPGRILKAQEALQLGLVTQIVEHDELMPSARALAQTLLLNSPQAMQAVKRLLAKHARRRLDEEIEDAIEANAQQRSTEDFKEGVQAFLEHRRPTGPA